MNIIDEKYFINPEEYIPNGFYCYNGNNLCPFWDIDKSKPKQNNGYCHYLKHADWEQEYISLIWDKCKECDVNIDIDFE